MFLNDHNIKGYSRLTYLGVVFAGRFNRTIKDDLERPVSETRDSNWVVILPTITKQWKIELIHLPI